jgi:hypothetical protein
MSLWKRLIAYEKSNPQRLDPNLLRARVKFVYEQCLLCLYFYPAMWYRLLCLQIQAQIQVQVQTQVRKNRYW